MTQRIIKSGLGTENARAIFSSDASGNASFFIAAIYTILVLTFSLKQRSFR